MDKRKDLTYEEIEQLGHRYKLDVHATVNSTFVKSSKDNWLICNEEDGYILYHENTRKQYKYKGNFNHGYHFQRAFPSITRSSLPHTEGRR